MSISKGDYIEAYNKVNKHMMWAYSKTLCELEITDVPGYWEDKDGRTYTFFDERKDRYTGKFTSPYRSWRILKQWNLNKEPKEVSSQ